MEPISVTKLVFIQYMNVLEEWKEKRERGSDGEIEIDKYHFGLSNSVFRGAAMCYHEGLFCVWYIGIRRIFNILFPT